MTVPASTTGPTITPRGIGKILVMAYGHTADTLPAGPCLAALHETYPAAEVHVLVVDDVAELWRACPHVDDVRVMRDFRWKGTRFSRLEQLARLAELTGRLGGRYDMAIVLHARSWFFNCLAYSIRARYRAGYKDHHPERWLTHHALPYDGIVSFREENRRVLAALGVTVTNPHLEIWPTPTAEAEAEALLKSAGQGPLIGLHPGSHWACQRWHNDRWAAVADRLTEDYGAQVIITGSSDERGLAEEIAGSMRSSPIIATGATSILGFAEVVRRCQVLLCVNSAASQVGLAVRTPVINLVGLEPLAWTAPEPDETMTVVRQCGESSTGWCPLGIWGRLSHCQRQDHVALAGLEPIEPDHVLTAARPWLEQDFPSSAYVSA